jgi:hypothetical protein
MGKSMKKFFVAFQIFCLTVGATMASTPAKATDCVVGPGANLAFCNFQGRDLSGADFTDSELAGANFAGANLTGATFLRASVHGADLTGANLTNAILVQTILGSSNLTRANLTGADMGSSGLWNANFTDAVFTSTTQLGSMTNTNLTGVNLHPFVGRKIGIPRTLPKEYYLDENDYLRLKFRLSPYPTISGKAQVNQSLTATVGVWDGGTTIQTKWYSGDRALGFSPTTLKINVIGAYVGQVLCVETHAQGARIRSRYVQNAYTRVSIARKTCTEVVKGLPISIKTPKISGTVKTKQTVRVSVSAWVSGATIRFQWLLDGQPISGATKSSYMIPTSLKNKRLSVKVTQQRSGYQTASATSTSIKVG